MPRMEKTTQGAAHPGELAELPSRYSGHFRKQALYPEQITPCCSQRPDSLDQCPYSSTNQRGSSGRSTKTCLISNTRAKRSSASRNVSCFLHFWNPLHNWGCIWRLQCDDLQHCCRPFSHVKCPPYHHHDLNTSGAAQIVCCSCRYRPHVHLCVHHFTHLFLTAH